MLNKHDVSKIIHSFESTRKVRTIDVICYCKMTSVMALDGVASVLRLKVVTITCLQTFATQSNFWGELFCAMAESRKRLKTSNVFRRLLCVRIELDQLLCVNC